MGIWAAGSICWFLSHQNFAFVVFQNDRRGSVNMWKVKNFLDKLKFKRWVDLTDVTVSVCGSLKSLSICGCQTSVPSSFRCQLSYSSKSLDAYSTLMSDVVHTVPPELLGALLYEELTEQRDRMLFSEGATGGALAFVPFSQSDSSSSQRGCLLYPGNQGLDCLSILQIRSNTETKDLIPCRLFNKHLFSPPTIFWANNTKCYCWNI